MQCAFALGQVVRCIQRCCSFGHGRQMIAGFCNPTVQGKDMCKLSVPAGTWRSAYCFCTDQKGRFCGAGVAGAAESFEYDDMGQSESSFIDPDMMYEE